MRLLIDIPEDKYYDIMEFYHTYPHAWKEAGLSAIRNGQPVPEKPLEKLLKIYEVMYDYTMEPDFDFSLMGWGEIEDYLYLLIGRLEDIQKVLKGK